MGEISSEKLRIPDFSLKVGDLAVLGTASYGACNWAGAAGAFIRRDACLHVAQLAPPVHLRVTPGSVLANLCLCLPGW